jgi:hypothetical protein
VVLFDPSQSHAVIKRGSSGFDESDFPDEHDCTQVFLTWELPIKNSAISQMLQISLETTLPADIEKCDTLLSVDGSQSIVCPESGQWLQAKSVT